MNKIIYVIVLVSIATTTLSQTVSFVGGDHQFYESVQDKCAKCHGDIKIQLSASSEHSSNSCTFCHTRSEDNHTNTRPVCQDCHSSVRLNDTREAHPGFANLGSEGCIACHTTYNVLVNYSRPEYIDYTITNKNGDWVISDVKTTGKLDLSYNAMRQGGNHNVKNISCRDCHKDIFDAVSAGGHAVVLDKNGAQVQYHDNTNSNMEAWCRTCHDRSDTKFTTQQHSVRKTTCEGCHQAYNLTPHPGNFFTNINTVPHLYRSLVCISCHSVGWPEPGVIYFKVRQEPYFNVEYKIITPLSITSSSPAGDPTTEVGTAQTFSIAFDRTADVTWYKNGSEIFTVLGVTSSSYTNSNAAIGVYNITATATDGYSSVMRTWNWTVTASGSGGDGGGGGGGGDGGSGVGGSGDGSNSISGYVFDNYGAGLEGVTVKGTMDNITAENTTVADGYYSITNLSSGTYNFSFSKAGFDTDYFEFTFSGGVAVKNMNMTIYDTTPPGQVTGLRSDNLTGSTVNLSWDPAEDANYYQVFRNSDSLGYTRNTYWNDTGLTPNVLYQYMVRANDSYNNWGQNSSVLTVNIPLTIISWSPLEDPTTTEGTAQTFEVVLNKTADVTWYVNDSIAGSNSSVISANYTNSTAGTGVYNVTVFASDGYNWASRAWNWTVSEQPTYNVSGYVFDNNGVGLGNVDVLVQNGSKQNITSASGYYLITGLLNGTYNFSYSKTGFDTGYLDMTINGTDNTTANKTIYDTTPPAQVTGLRNDTPTQTTVNLSWDPIADASYYQVFRNSASLGYTQNTYWNDTGLIADTLYQYDVRANDSYDNWGQNSSILSIKTAVAADTIPPASVSNPSTTTGNFFINNTWVNPADADFNYVWFRYSNDTTLQNVSNPTNYLNLTWPPHYTQNISAQTVDNSGNVNQTKVWFNATIPNNAPVQATIGDKIVTEGDLLIFNVSATDIDLDTITYGTNATGGSLNPATGEYSWQTSSGDSGTYIWYFNSSDGFGGVASETITITVTVSPPTMYIPPDPVNLASTQGNFWINYTWQAGAGNATDSYNISVNGIWTNGTISTYYNNSVGPHGWSNITVWAYNNSGGGSLSSASVSQNTQVANNIPMQEPIGDITIDENQPLQFTVTATDADSDLITYGTNATKGSFNTTTGEFSWTPGYGDAGVYIWYFNSSDSYGGVVSEIITVTVNDVPLSITSSSPVSDPTTTVGTEQTFEVNLNRTADIIWYIDGSIVQNNLSAISAYYTNFTADTGVYNVTVTVNDSYDSVSRTWNWTIIEQPTYSVSGYVFDNYGLGLGDVLVQNSISQNTTTTSGYYLITGLLNGTYNFSYSKDGFNTDYLEVAVNGADIINVNKTIYDTTPPAQVTGLMNDTPTQTTVNLTWDSIVDANYYQIFRDSASIGYTQNTYWNDTGLLADTLYEYAVRANDSYNNWGQNSSILSVKTAQAADTTPPASVSNPGTTTGNFYINNTWVNPEDTDFSYVWFRYSDGTILQNVTSPTNYLNLTWSPHYTQNISAQTVDISGNVNQTKVWFNATIPNNVPIQLPIGDKIVTEGDLLIFNVSATDADSDTITYGTNATKGTFNTTTGEFSWTPGYGDAGVYVWYFNSSDGFGGVASEIITVTVNNVPLSITSSSPVGDPATTFGTEQTFGIYLNRTADVTWYIDGSIVQTDLSVVSASYTNSTAGIGMYNVTATANDSYDSVSRTWNWTVIEQPTYSVSGYVFDNYGSGLGDVDVLVQNGSYQNTTIASGYYLINGLLNSTYNFSFSKAGLDTGYLEVIISGADIINANKTIYDTTPPAQVTGLMNDTPTQTTVNISWDPIADASYYQVFRDSASIGYTQNTYWNDTGLIADTLYEYVVRANDSYNNWGQNSSILSVRTAPAADTTSPASVSNPSTTIGNFYINNTWVNPEDTDFSYIWFRYSNDTTLQNVSKPISHLNLTWQPHYTQNISAQTVDTSGNVNQTKVWFNATIPNNVPIQFPIGDRTVTEGDLLTFNVSATDADSDTIIYGTNATGGSLNPTTGEYSWQTSSGDSGTYIWYFNSSDSYGGVASEIITVTVNDVPLSITSSSPVSDPTTTAGTEQTFEINLNRNADVTWYIDGSIIQNNSNVASANYADSTAGIGMYNVTATANDSYDSVSRTWNWTVIEQPTYSVSGYVFDNYGSGLGDVDVLVQNDSKQNTTIASGYYQITGLLDGIYNFSYSKAGFNTDYLEVAVNGADITNVNITIYDTTPPAQIIGLRNDTPMQTTVNISWDPIAGASYYQVFRDSASLGYTQNTYWNDTELTPDTLYGYAVRANDSYNNWGQNSSILSVRTAQAADTTPPASVSSPAMMTGNFYINNTWINPVDADFSYVWFRYSNGTTLQNVSKPTNYLNLTWSPHYTQNISAQTVDTSGNVNQMKVWFNATIPNNAPAQSQIGNKAVDEGQLLTFTVTATDADNDAVTHGTNATKGSFNTATGEFSWTPDYGDAGVYIWYFNSSDGYGGVASETITVTVNDIQLSITSSLPSSDPTTTQGEAQSFSITLNRTANVSWYMNGAQVQTNTSVTSASYADSTASIGTYNVTAIASDSYDSVSRTWIWSVIEQPAYNVSGYVFDNYGSGLGGVLVQNGSSQSITTASGYYLITGLLNGTYNFSYSKAGFDTGYLEITISGTDIVNANRTIYDTTPPASIDSIAAASAPLYINWTWTDPADADLNHVEVYIDGTFKSNVTKGVQHYNATYFKPSSTHTISTRTVDIYGNMNMTWINNTATTASAYTYVSGFLDITGTVTDFSSAQSDSDGGASAMFSESPSGGGSRDNYTYVTGYTASNGTVTNFAGMQSAGDGAFATLTEGAVTSSAQHRWTFDTTNELWTSSYTAPDSSATVTMSFNPADGNPPGSINSSLVSSKGGVYTATTTWTSPNFTWTNGTPASARLDFDWKVATYDKSADTGSYYAILVKPDGSTAQIYPTTPFSSTAAWSTKSNTTVSVDDFTQSGNYSLRLVAVLKTQESASAVEVGWDNPTLTLNYTSYRLDITTDTASVPADENYYLEINYSRDTGEKGYDLYVFNGTAWNNRGSLDSIAWTVFNISLSDQEYNNGNPRIRYVDQTPAGITQGNLYIDYQRIHGFTPVPPAYSLNITTNITDIPDASTHILQLRYNVLDDDFVLQIWNGSAWNSRTILNDTSPSYRNITLFPEELIPYRILAGSAGSINSYYVLVRYLDLNANTAQQGRLYLDYQRVYSE